MITTDNDRVVFIDSPVRSVEQLSRELEDKFPEIAPLNRLLAHCVQHYERALSGDIEAISVLYPEGELNPLADSEEYAKTYQARALYIDLLSEIISRVVQTSSAQAIANTGSRHRER